MDKVQNSFRVLVTGVKKTRADYEDLCKKMSDEERLKESNSKMEAYKALCLGGLTSMYWKDTSTLLNKVRTINGTVSSVISGGFAISQAGMLVGLAASSFPKASAWSEVAASNGSLCAVLFNIAAFHLEIFEFLPPALLLTSWVVSSVLFSIYWFVSSQDLTIAKLALKLVCLIMTIIVYCMKFVIWLVVFIPFDLLCKWALSGTFNTYMGLVSGETPRDRPRPQRPSDPVLGDDIV